jgi:hypothetical protein
MRGILLGVFLAASAAAQAQETLSNGGMPANFPATIQVARVPLGSGVPSPGRSTGFSAAVSVGDGLYTVPGYLPGGASAANIAPRVVDVACVPSMGAWYCQGYHIDGVLQRGENIYIRPDFKAR